jgi:hypothetical protein
LRAADQAVHRWPFPINAPNEARHLIPPQPAGGASSARLFRKRRLAAFARREKLGYFSRNARIN